MGSRLGGGQGVGFEKNFLSLNACFASPPSLSCLSPRAETHRLVLSSSLQLQRKQRPVGDPSLSLPGQPQDSEALASLDQGTPSSHILQHVLYSWGLGNKPLPPSPPSPLHLFLPFSPLRFHYSSPFFSTTSQGVGYKLLLRDTKPPLISAPTAPAKTGLCPPNLEG